ncbi:MAG: hypothetical protein WBM41_16165 [Arenicellales bacterium]
MQHEYVVIGGDNHNCKIKADLRILLRQLGAEVVANLAKRGN